MEETGVKKLIFISSIEICDVPLKPYWKATDVIEASNLDYIILRPAWFTRVNEVDYETTGKANRKKARWFPKKAWLQSLWTLSNLLKDTLWKPGRKQIQFLVIFFMKGYSRAFIIFIITITSCIAFSFNTFTISALSINAVEQKRDQEGAN
jgi:NAD(P)H-binding